MICDPNYPPCAHPGLFRSTSRPPYFERVPTRPLGAEPTPVWMAVVGPIGMSMVLAVGLWAFFRTPEEDRRIEAALQGRASLRRRPGMGERRR